MMASSDAGSLAGHAAEAAATLKLVANEQRLLLLCRLSAGETSVGDLVALTGMSQSSVSQHLAKLRLGGLVQTRREATNVYYSLAGDDVRQLIDVLCTSFGGACAVPARMM